ncbi:MAG: hypothetical protein U5L72_03825 [Bacteroidales bacterium]|nr:hypothetical protein [Bacteroidales bacterium]
MKNLAPVGRILFALPFAFFGINHFLMMDYYLGMLTSFVPLGGYTIILTGSDYDRCKYQYHNQKVH